MLEACALEAFRPRCRASARYRGIPEGDALLRYYKCSWSGSEALVARRIDSDGALSRLLVTQCCRISTARLGRGQRQSLGSRREYRCDSASPYIYAVSVMLSRNSRIVLLYVLAGRLKGLCDETPHLGTAGITLRITCAQLRQGILSKLLLVFIALDELPFREFAWVRHYVRRRLSWGREQAVLNEKESEASDEGPDPSEEGGTFIGLGMRVKIDQMIPG